MNDSPQQTAKSEFPADVYSDTVLSHVFADAQRLFLPALIDIDLAHVLMLSKQGILTSEQARVCLRAIRSLDIEAIRTVRYDGSVEDLFFYVEQKLAEAAGSDNAGRIHTARSRNDLDLTMYRMTLRERLLDVLESSLKLRDVLLGIAREYRDAIIPAYTHNQPAQPTTLGHFLAAYLEVLERDADRLIGCYARVNRSSLGACAITTTGFPIDRTMTADALGFRGLVVNSYGAIASVDYLAEACSVLATAMLSMGRFTQEMLLWSTAEFGYLKLSNGYVQVSSIMPQKRNPVPLEHTRILASRAMTEAQSVIGSLHNTPFTDMNDGEDSLQPLVALAFTDAQRATTLLAGALSEATFYVDRMRKRAGESFLTVTELADMLVRTTEMSFHHAHEIVSLAVRRAVTDDPGALAQDVYQQLQAEGIAMSYDLILRAMDPENFINVRAAVGGPAAMALEPELQRLQALLQRDHDWAVGERWHLASKKRQLLESVDSIINVGA